TTTSQTYTLSLHDALPISSIGNYLAWASGLIQTNNDSFSGTFSDPNIAQDVEKAGLTWKDYVEDISSSCPGLNSGGYAEKHDPRSEEHTSELQSRFDLVCR